MPSRSSSKIELRRARPLLGTLVEVRATAPTPAQAERALRAAFAAIERVHALMSFHDPQSDLSRLNRTAHRRAVRIHAWTFTVLRRAQKLHTATGGLFDIAMAPALVRGGWLPRSSTALPTTGGTAADICFLPDRRVRFHRPLLIDLGGIAKGFAVDRAVAALRRHGATAGTINAGGDLRVFGRRPELVHVRRPESPGALVPLLELRSGAVATSAHYFAQRRIRGIACAPIFHPLRRQLSRETCSVTVQAPECWLADALCKIVWLDAAAAAPLLRRYGARAWMLDARRHRPPLASPLHAA